MLDVMRSRTATTRWLAGLVALLLVSAAAADQYWIAYEGSDFPENQGWSHEYGDEHGQYAGGASRYIDTGQLVIDSRRHLEIVDFARMTRPLNHSDGELFAVEWRLEVVEASSSWPFDQTVGVFTDDARAVAFAFGPQGFISELEEFAVHPVMAGVPHDYRLESTDLLSYDLFIDGSFARHGVFVQVVSSSRVGWGDGVQGASSLARWGYFRFGIVPEPASLNLAAFALLLALARGGKA